MFLASSVNLHDTSNTNIFRSYLRVRLSSIKSPVLRKYPNPFKRHTYFSMYPSISKCNVKSCNCCEHLCNKTTNTLFLNGRHFSVILILILILIENQ